MDYLDFNGQAGLAGITLNSAELGKKPSSLFMHTAYALPQEGVPLFFVQFTLNVFFSRWDVNVQST